MAAPAFLVNSIIAVEQTVADFLVTPSALTSTQALNLITLVEGLRGGIQALPITATVKTDFLNRLNAVEAILSGFANGTSGVEDVDVLNSVLTSLTLLKQKIQVQNIPVSCGTLTVSFPCQFSTTSQCICP